MKQTLSLLALVGSSVLISTLTWAQSLSKTVYDFDDTLMATTANVVIYRNGVDPKSPNLSANDMQKVSTALWSEVRHQLGHEGQYKDWVLSPEFSFQNFSGKPGENAFLGHIQEAVTQYPTSQWQSPMWDDFVKALAQPQTAQDVYILTARSSTAVQVREGFQYLQTKGYLKHLMPMENIFAVSDPTLRLKSNPTLVLAKEKSEASKAMVMQEMLDELEHQASQLSKTQLTTATWAFYDDDFANFAKARDILVPQAASRWPHVRITIGYVGVLHAGVAPHEVVVLPSSHMHRMKKASGF